MSATPLAQTASLYRPVKLGPYTLPNNLFVAPMAGVTDRPFRRLCKQLGAGHAVSEMAASNPALWDSVKTSRRLNHDGEPAPVAVQLAGGDPAMMAEAARHNIDRGARIIDINMGCPVKKVCKVAAGSALLRDEDLVARIIDAVVAACSPHNIPVTLKTRTGWSRAERHALRVARRAQDQGIAMLTLHGRTREDMYEGQAEYDTIAEVKAALRIPVVANGDIDSPQKAREVLEYTGADAVMIGRAAQGNPWIFKQIRHYLETGTMPARPGRIDMKHVILEHLQEHYAFYGMPTGVRTARKHLGWYLSDLPGARMFLDHLNTLECPEAQYRAVGEFLDQPDAA
jgi:tRNA-dihydrouridine synthase B